MNIYIYKTVKFIVMDEMYSYVSGRQCNSVAMATPRLCVFLLSLVLIAYIPKINAQTSDGSKRILAKIFTTDAYNKAVRPTSNQSQVTNVSVDFSLTGIIEFDSQKEKLTTSGFLIISWNDYYLQWDPYDYNGTSNVFIHQDNVWKPDIALQNGISEFKGLGSSDLLVNVTNDGIVSWWPYAILQSTCKVDITYFPFDIQTCSLKFTAWSYYKTEVQLTVGSNQIMFDDYEENSAWTVFGSSVDTLPQSSDATVSFTMRLERKPLFYLLNVIVPVIMLSIMNTCVFVLPAKSDEKASFSMTVFLSLAVFLTIVTSTLPQNSDKVSYLGIYLVIMAGFSTLTVILTLFQLRLNSRDVKTDPIPSWLIKLHTIVERVRSRKCNKVRPTALAQNGVYIPSSDYNDTIDEKNVEVTKSKLPPPSEEETKVEIAWNNISNSLDFVFFWLYFVAVLVITVTVLSIMAKGVD
ncbi:hypothetical protein CHS0354_041212 [Potamilus streckersoni]|uniref:Uncharacterized protein n=1 Tax=Potamilus streckersoni TaxID=2493646 RepID=A0AAE0SE37_9BIVA|nr:hypothetical protein CHS0354_041212 [Potamilus streckersoni]